MKMLEFHKSFLSQYRLSSFLRISSNREGLKVAEQFISSYDLAPSVLIIHGSIGNGKTHLAGAVCSEIQRKHPDIRIYVSSSESCFDNLPDVDVLVVDSADLLLRWLESTTNNDHSSNFALLVEHCSKIGGNLIITSVENPLVHSMAAQYLKNNFEKIYVAFIGELCGNDMEIVNKYFCNQFQLSTRELPICKGTIRTIEAEVYRTICANG